MAPTGGDNDDTSGGCVDFRLGTELVPSPEASGDPCRISDASAFATDPGELLVLDYGAPLGGTGLTAFDVTIELGSDELSLVIPVDQRYTNAGTVVSGAGMLTFTGIERMDVTGSVYADTLTGTYRIISGANAAAERGVDIITGGDGADTFHFIALADSLVGSAGRDVIYDFASGIDRIDVAAIDADPGAPGDQALVWIGGNAFGGNPGELRAYVSGSNTLVEIDFDANRTADFQILLRLVQGLGQGDVIL